MERKDCDVEIEIISFVVNGNVKLTIEMKGMQWAVSLSSRLRIEVELIMDCLNTSQ